MRARCDTPLPESYGAVFIKVIQCMLSGYHQPPCTLLCSQSKQNQVGLLELNEQWTVGFLLVTSCTILPCWEAQRKVTVHSLLQYFINVSSLFPLPCLHAFLS